MKSFLLIFSCKYLLVCFYALLPRDFSASTAADKTNKKDNYYQNISKINKRLGNSKEQWEIGTAVF